MKRQLSIFGFAALTAVAVTGFAGDARGSVVSVLMEGVVETPYFGAESAFPVGTPVRFFVSYEADPQFNPDLDPLGSSGFFKFIRWDFLGFGGTGAGQFNGISVRNEMTDAVQFGVGSVQLPSFGGYSFNSGLLIFTDNTGTILDSDALPTVVPPGWFGGGSFLVRWGGADGPAIAGPLQVVVPEPSAVLLLAWLPLAVFGRRRW
jgi:hypothetical protein